MNMIEKFFKDWWRYIEESQMMRARRMIADYRDFRIGGWE